MSDILTKTTKKLLTYTKGILASDEGINSANRNLAKIGVEGTEKTRRAYRELFINTPRFEKYVSGVILCDETFWQEDSNGKAFRKTLKEKDVVLIVKVDEGLTEFSGNSEEKTTKGVEGLADRLPKYFEAGARATKWRTVFSVGKELPTDDLIETNTETLAKYALICQQNNIVPIVEPEVLYKGDHSFAQAQTVTGKVLKKTFDKLKEHDVNLREVILKTSMVLPGKSSGEDATPSQISTATIKVLRESVPNEVPGVVFLSGGQEPMQATINLDAIATANDTTHFATFSFLRAIEGPAAETWAGKEKNVTKAREVFLKKLELDSLASQGMLETAQW